MNIVLIDDDPTVLNILSRMFQRRGHEVLTYENPLACPIYKSPHGSCFPHSKCPDVIISDVDMPDVDGLHFVETIFTKGCKCRHVALLTGQGISNQDMKRMAEHGARCFTKPLDFAEFEAWVMFQEQRNN